MQGLLETLIGFSPLILVFVFFWFFLIRPQKKQQEQRQKMLNELKKGDKIITIGGIYGTITEINDNKITIRIADKVEVKAEKYAVDKVL
ncbi:preprotein translocase subunit YajC [Anaerobranca gottschalkii]|uniref:Protein translocase subunit yajC n=1 Tax=Anaerobranca gottschalkii DSM 13577 TaxID=1120990 RepID=A0A1I0BI17_9FIRM|nr:preprotein translocase subunit YajC [Anaerobranca gottschalkii]SET06457.1 protein translocase subunit yajC [Anaerobranca gottschalkii DSM 13577]